MTISPGGRLTSGSRSEVSALSAIPPRRRVRRPQRSEARPNGIALMAATTMWAAMTSPTCAGVEERQQADEAEDLISLTHPVYNAPAYAQILQRQILGRAGCRPRVLDRWPHRDGGGRSRVRRAHRPLHSP